MNLDDIFEQGKADADRICGAEDPFFHRSSGRHYTRATYGMAAVFRALGREGATYRDLAHWHYPMASATGGAEETVAWWADNLESVLGSGGGPIPGDVQETLEMRYSAWRFTTMKDKVNALHDEEGIRQVALGWADQRVKEGAEKIRRGTKKYMAAVQALVESLTERVRAERKTSALRELLSLEKWVTATYQQGVAGALGHVITRKRAAEDVLLLKPQSGSAAQALEIASKLERRLRARAEGVRIQIEEWKKELE